MDRDVSHLLGIVNVKVDFILLPSLGRSVWSTCTVQCVSKRVDTQAIISLNLSLETQYGRALSPLSLFVSWTHLHGLCNYQDISWAERELSLLLDIHFTAWCYLVKRIKGEVQHSSLYQKGAYFSQPLGLFCHASFLLKIFQSLYRVL